MFLPWTLFFVNLILVTTRFLVVTAVGAILAIYSRLRGEHANSIRWVRQGGYLEMFSFLINTRKDITMQAKAALLFTIVATLAAGLIGRGAVRFVEPTTRQTNSTSMTIKTKQYIPSTDQGTISGWSRSLYNGSNVLDVMSSMMNDTEITMVVPNAIPGRIYIPQTINYTVGCGDVGLSALMRTGAFVLRNTGCARIHVTVLGVIDYDETGVIVTKRSSERWSISVPAVFYDIIAEMSVGARVIQNNVTCATWSVLGGVMDSPRDGQTSLPTTLSTKCMYPSGNVTSLSLSAIRFMTSTVGQFSNVSKTSFNEYDELFQAMELNLNNSNGAQGNCTLFAEVQYVNDTVNTLSCYTAPNPNNNITFVTCTYVIIRAIIISQQDLNPTIAATLEEGGSPPDLTTIMTFTHMPNSNGNRSAETSISAIRNINSVVADYIASLGQNLCVDWNHGQVTIMFDTTDTEGGLSIPFWLIVSVPVIAVICAILLGSTEYFLDGRYTTSLYKAISMPMRSRMNSFAPMLMRSRVDPVEFEGIPVVPSGRGFETDLKNVATIQSDRSSSTTLVHQKHSSFL